MVDSTSLASYPAASGGRDRLPGDVGVPYQRLGSAVFAVQIGESLRGSERDLDHLAQGDGVAAAPDVVAGFRYRDGRFSLPVRGVVDLAGDGEVLVSIAGVGGEGIVTKAAELGKSEVSSSGDRACGWRATARGQSGLVRTSSRAATGQHQAQGDARNGQSPSPQVSYHNVPFHGASCQFLSV